ncbi:hypothetical protein SeLEV6574_g04996 [Synchytrium endobioticum]|uniref:Uncharacterized protein n=1 Tax=Synchytrium endobioticum TaxID=286115 RepID=A0A507CWL9_9FUNG|nr:hypothetical protein SeLEV6574_g04996 [Synchytrium endobioticum]
MPNSAVSPRKMSCAARGASYASRERGDTSTPALSGDTLRLIKAMMKTAKLTHRQQHILDACLLDTQPPALPTSFPPSSLQCPPISDPPKPKPARLTYDPKAPCRRTYEDIVRSGAYQVDAFRPTPKRDSSIEKRKLQNLMATGKPSGDDDDDDDKSAAPRPHSYYPHDDADYEDDEFGRLLAEVRERKEWLNDMKDLGALKREDETRTTAEIALRLSRLEQLHKARP